MQGNSDISDSVPSVWLSLLSGGQVADDKTVSIEDLESNSETFEKRKDIGRLAT